MKKRILFLIASFAIFGLFASMGVVTAGTGNINCANCYIPWDGSICLSAAYSSHLDNLCEQQCEGYTSPCSDYVSYGHWDGFSKDPFDGWEPWN